MTTKSRGSKRSRGWADADPTNGLHIPTIAWREEMSWNQGARNPENLAKLARKDMAEHAGARSSQDAKCVQFSSSPWRHLRLAQHGGGRQLVVRRAL